MTTLPERLRALMIDDLEYRIGHPHPKFYVIVDDDNREIFMYTDEELLEHYDQDGIVHLLARL